MTGPLDKYLHLSWGDHHFDWVILRSDLLADDHPR